MRKRAEPQLFEVSQSIVNRTFVTFRFGANWSIVNRTFATFRFGANWSERLGYGRQIRERAPIFHLHVAICALCRTHSAFPRVFVWSVLLFLGPIHPLAAAMGYSLSFTCPRETSLRIRLVCCRVGGFGKGRGAPRGDGGKGGKGPRGPPPGIDPMVGDWLNGSHRLIVCLVNVAAWRWWVHFRAPWVGPRSVSVEILTVGIGIGPRGTSATSALNRIRNGRTWHTPRRRRRRRHRTPISIHVLCFWSAGW